MPAAALGGARVVARSAVIVPDVRVAPVDWRPEAGPSCGSLAVADDTPAHEGAGFPSPAQ